MPMTLAELLALLPDNTTGDIGADDMRTITTELYDFPTTVIDTTTVDLSGTGTAGTPLSAVVRPGSVSVSHLDFDVATQAELNTAVANANAGDAALAARVNQIVNFHATGIATMDRRMIAAAYTLVTQRMILGYVSCQSALTVANIRMYCAAAAAATPTLCQYVLYHEETNGSLTLVGSTASDTTMFATANLPYDRALTSAVPLVVGDRYAAGVLVNSPVTMPGVAASFNLAIGHVALSYPPRLNYLHGVAAAPPATITAPAVGANIGMVPYVELLP